MCGAGNVTVMRRDESVRQAEPAVRAGSAGLSAGAFAGVLGGGLAVVAGFAVLGGWPGLAGIVVAAVMLTGFVISRG